MGITPRLGVVRYGAADLRRVYKKNMSLAFLLAAVLIGMLVQLLRFIVGDDDFSPHAKQVVRIALYAADQTPVHLGNGTFGLTSHPVLVSDESLVSSVANARGKREPAATNDKTKTPGRFVPSQQFLSGPLGGLPDAAGGAEKNGYDRQPSRVNDPFSPANVPNDRHDIAGGGGASDQPNRRGGIPVAGKNGEPPSGYDRSGVGASSKPSFGGAPYGLGSGVTGEGGGSGYSVQWGSGGTARKKLNGVLPQYPPGVNTGGQVQILTTVRPNGTVQSVQPVQKVHAKLEQAALDAVRTWNFERLPSSIPQVNQTCVITFRFKLK